MAEKMLQNYKGISSDISKIERVGWLIWGTAMCAQLFNMFHRIAMSVAIDRVMADMKINAQIAGNLIAMHFLIYAFMQFPSGLFADSSGPRKTITIGCLISGVGALIFGLGQSLIFLYTGRILVALGVSVIFVSVLKVGAEWFQPKKFPLIASLVTIVSSVGSLVATSPLAVLVNRYGWRLSFNIVGISTLVVGLVCWIIIRDDPMQKGFNSLRGNGLSDSNQGNIKSERSPRVNLTSKIKIVISTKQIYPLFLMALGIYGTVMVFQGAWGIPYLMQVYNLSRKVAANYILIILLSQTIGSILIPFLTEKFLGRKKMALICSFMYTLSWALLAFWGHGKPPNQALFPILVAFGFLVGYLPIIYSSTTDSVPREASGIALGVVNFGSFVAAAVLQIIVGRILDLRWDGHISQGARIFSRAAYQEGFVLVFMAVLASIIGAIWFRPDAQNIHNLKR